MENPEWAQIIVDLGLAIVVGLLGLYQWLSKKDQVNADQIDHLEKQMLHEIRVHAERMARIEVRIDQSPSRDDLSRSNAKIHARIDQYSTALSRVEGKLGTLDLIHDYLIREPRK